MDEFEMFIAGVIRSLRLKVDDKFQVAKDFAKELDLRSPDFVIYRDDFLRACSPPGVSFDRWA